MKKALLFIFCLFVGMVLIDIDHAFKHLVFHRMYFIYGFMGFAFGLIVKYFVEVKE